MNKQADIIFLQHQNLCQNWTKLYYSIAALVFRLRTTMFTELTKHSDPVANGVMDINRMVFIVKSFKHFAIDRS